MYSSIILDVNEYCISLYIVTESEKSETAMLECVSGARNSFNVSPYNNDLIYPHGPQQLHTEHYAVYNINIMYIPNIGNIHV